MAAQRPNAARSCVDVLYIRFSPHAHLPLTSATVHTFSRSVNEWVRTVCETRKSKALSFICRVRCECKSRVHSSNWRSFRMWFHFILLHHSLPYSSRHFLFASQNHSPFGRQYTIRYSFIEAQVSWISICQEVRLLRLNFRSKQH